ncbi:hypothetical protein [Vallitalea guaymasensis]|uniref:hypothetical protein n=1 Tax=Vallitalea guaymasensis TaxID=1185412 RepID=UPI000DE2796C|nr:hypothetical protein [Vallitalea guaymasensis]
MAKVFIPEDSGNSNIHFYRMIDEQTGAWTHAYVYDSCRLIILSEYGNYMGTWYCFDNKDFRKKLISMSNYEILLRLADNGVDLNWFYKNATIDNILDRFKLEDLDYRYDELNGLRKCECEYDIIRWNDDLPIDLRIDSNELLELFYYGYSPYIMKINGELLPELKATIKQQLDEEQKVGVKVEEVQEEQSHAVG